MPAEIALQRLYARARPGDIHRAKRAGQHTAFTADTARLFHKDMPVLAAYRLRRTDVRARRVFALVTGDRRGEGMVFNDPDAWSKLPGRNRRAVLIFLMRNHTGDFAGTTADTLRRIRHNKPVHSSLRQHEKSRVPEAAAWLL
ncbi:hypothetical protein ROD_42361 [Citrobacter rodentium ICC168]|uniref:Uncharacterized protein n=1 Tax=Citrobacter rodentium (strain ICC168) TaxID=637910 RepID=D2TJT5_CITRI|nr:hypothetical protein ROD_42361 [Citrobacter rodentium ICC168]